MYLSKLSYKKIKKRYLQFLKSQEVMSEPFRDKVGQLNNFYLPISLNINKYYKTKKKTLIIGLTGSQGSGKSTISNILKIILKEGFKLNTIALSIDDFYKTLRERVKMSKKVSPLFLTRGVPGTHDTKLLYNCLIKLKKKKFKKFTVPKFDKSNDDRFKKAKWHKITKKPDIVIFEGWCVGATPQKNKDLILPVNVLEKEKDKKRIWRNKVNQELKTNYKKIFNLINKNIFLNVPNFNYVYKWRLLQEKKLILKTKGKKTMNSDQIKNFIMFYERITKDMMKDFTKISDLTIFLDKSHRSKKMRFN